MEKYIVRFTPKIHWEEAQKKGFYRAEDFDKDGFIHCSKIEQVVRIANVFAKGEKGLALLLIELKKVVAPVKFERRHAGEEKFPHIYGVLNLDAVKEIYDFEPDEEGFFKLPF